MIICLHCKNVYDCVNHIETFINPQTNTINNISYVARVGCSCTEHSTPLLWEAYGGNSMKSTITNNKHSSAGGHESISMFTALDMREKLGDQICDMPKRESDKIEPESGEGLENLTNNLETLQEKARIQNKPKVPKKTPDELETELKQKWADEELEELERLGIFELNAEYAGTFESCIEDSLEYGCDPIFFGSDYAIEKYDADNNKKIDGLVPDDKRDIIYKKGFNSSTTSTSARLPDFYTHNVINNVMRSEDCFGQTMAYVHSTANGLAQTMRDLSSPECRSRKIYMSVMTYLQKQVPRIKNAPVQNNLNSVHKFDDKLRVDRPREITEPSVVYLFKKVKGITGDLAEINKLTQTDCIRLLENNMVLGSKKRFDEADKEIAENDRKLILAAIDTAAKLHARDATNMYRLYKPHLGKQEIEYIEKRMKLIDKIFVTPHCKHCYNNDTKLSRNKTDKRKAQYFCNTCKRFFSVSDSDIAHIV